MKLLALVCFILAAAPAAHAHSGHGGRVLLGAKAGKWCPTGALLTPQDIIARDEIFYVRRAQRPISKGRGPCRPHCAARVLFPCSISVPLQYQRARARWHCSERRCTAQPRAAGHPFSRALCTPLLHPATQPCPVLPGPRPSAPHRSALPPTAGHTSAALRRRQPASQGVCSCRQHKRRRCCCRDAEAGVRYTQPPGQGPGHKSG